MLKRVGDLPKSNFAPRRSYVESDVREFARNKTYDVAEVVIEGHDGKHVHDAIKRYLTTHKDKYKGIKVALRKGRAYLYRDLKEVQGEH